MIKSCAIIICLFREVGPRSKVWTEEEMLEVSAWEFAEVSATSYLSKYDDMVFMWVCCQTFCFCLDLTG